MKKYMPLIIGVILLGADQYFKIWILKNSSNVFINQSFILGFGGRSDLYFWIALTAILVLSLFAVHKDRLNYWAFSLMIVGALSNLIDRFVRGGVVDYFKFNYFNMTINFNFSDILLIIGLGIYLYEITQYEKKHQN